MAIAVLGQRADPVTRTNAEPLLYPGQPAGAPPGVAIGVTVALALDRVATAGIGSWRWRGDLDYVRLVARVPVTDACSTADSGLIRVGSRNCTRCLLTFRLSL